MPSKSSNDPERFKGQTRIEGDQVGQGDIPEDQLCDWCSNPATDSFEKQRVIRGARGGGATWGTGQFWFACDEHHETAKRIAKDAFRPHRKKL